MSDPPLLFDFHKTGHVIKQELVVSQNRIVFLDPLTGLVFANQSYVPNHFTQSLAKLEVSFEQTPKLHPPLSGGFKMGLWKSVQNHAGHLVEPMSQGEFFKIGLQVFQLKAIYTKESMAKEANTNWDGGKESFREQSYSVGQEGGASDFYNCRICTVGPSKANPFIANLCKCKSSSIHLNCLKKWMTQKAFISEFQNLKYYNRHRIECEICKTKLPSQIKIEGRNIDLVNFADDQHELILLFSFFHNFSEREGGNLVVCYGANDVPNIKIGRSEDNDIVFAKEEVESEHALLVRKKNQFYLVDLGTKYNTYKLITDQVDLNQGRGVDFCIAGFRLKWDLVDPSKRHLAKCLPKSSKKKLVDPIQQTDKLHLKDSLVTSRLSNGNQNGNKNNFLMGLDDPNNTEVTNSQMPQMLFSKKDIRYLYRNDFVKEKKTESHVATIKEGLNQHKINRSNNLTKKETTPDTNVENHLNIQNTPKSGVVENGNGKPAANNLESHLNIRNQPKPKVIEKGKPAEKPKLFQSFVDKVEAQSSAKAKSVKPVKNESIQPILKGEMPSNGVPKGTDQSFEEIQEDESYHFN